MPRQKIAKSKRSDAERAAEHYLYHVFGCDPAQIVRAVRTKWQAVDFWGCDVMGRDTDGNVYFAQVTTGQVEAVRTRRRKLEQISWNRFDSVFVLQMVSIPNPVNQARKDFYFRVHAMIILGHSRTDWIVEEKAYLIPREWFKKLRVESGK